MIVMHEESNLLTHKLINSSYTFIHSLYTSILYFNSNNTLLSMMDGVMSFLYFQVVVHGKR